MPKPQPQAAPDFIPAESSPDFIPADDLAAPKLTVGAPSQSPLNTKANPSGEGPIAQAFTTMETKIADTPSSLIQAMKNSSKYGKRNYGEYAPLSAQQSFPDVMKKLNPIDTNEGNLAMNIGGTASNLLPLLLDMEGGGIAESPVGKLTTSIAQPLKKFALAPSDPDALYHSYLRPVADAPMPTPSAPKPVMRAIVRDMEAAGEGEAANRIQNGKATVGDLDQMRQRANRLARSIYRSPGNYSPGIAEGANDLASSIREKTYPFIESSQNMEPGSLQGIKKLQGAAMDAERHPTLTNRVIKKGIGGAAGGMLGYKIAGEPGMLAGAMAGQQLSEPLANAMDRGILGFKTKALASRLPAPGLTPRLGLPPARILSPIESVPGAPSFNEFNNPSTRAQRLGLLLPEGKPTIELPSSMEPIEKVPEGSSTPKGRFTEDTRTGRLKKQYLTSSANQ